jgi:BASS family bile acid:Na+ symporter
VGAATLVRVHSLILESLPYALGVVMLGLGLSLTGDDFRRVAEHPRVVALSLACQLVLLPAVCFVLVISFGLAPELAVGLMVVAASPGGPTANLFSHLFGGNVALNVTLTAINSLLIVITLPVVVNLSAAYFLPEGASLGLQLDKIVQVFVIVIGPVLGGMLVRAAAPGAAAFLRGPVRALSVVVLLVVIGAVLWGMRSDLADYFVRVGLAVLAFNLISLLVGYGVPRLARVDHAAATASAFEIGIHNTALAITVALSPALLDNADMAIPGAVYGIVMFLTATAFGLGVGRRHAQVGTTTELVGDRAR